MNNTTSDPEDAGRRLLPALTIRVLRWPVSTSPYWLAGHRTGRGYFPVRMFGSTWQDGCRAILAGRELAKEWGCPFVSEVNLLEEQQ